MSEALKRHWFLVGLVTFIPLALALAASEPDASVVDAVDMIPTGLCTAAILFLMSITLNSGKLVRAMKSPGPVITAVIVNQLAIPLMALPLLSLQASADLRVGLLIAACVPCTMAAASVWTRRANGNDAVSLLVTLLTNGFCFLAIPIWLAVGSRWFDTVDANVGIDFSSMMTKLVSAALVPATIGQLLRIHAPTQIFVDRRKPWFSTAAQLIILMLVFVSAFRGGGQFAAHGVPENLRHLEFATVWLCCIGLHLTAAVVSGCLARSLKFSSADLRACVFAGSQKTLPIGILVSQATGLPFSLVPMLMYHASQLFIDTWIADWLAASTAPNTIDT